MSIITAQLTSKNYYKNSFFDLLIDTDNSSTKITISFFTSEVTTEKITDTSSILKQQLPSILRSKCFNEYKLPFKTEVKNTELGHLFEHILLEYICEVKRGLGHPHPVHNGMTSWNWYKEKRGLFNIKIDLDIKDKDVLQLALHKTIKLTDEILLSGEKRIIVDQLSGKSGISAAQLQLK